MNYSSSNFIYHKEKFIFDCLSPLMPLWGIDEQGLPMEWCVLGWGWHSGQVGKWTITLSWNHNKASLNLKHVLHKHVKRDLGSITHAWNGNALSSSERSNQPGSSTDFYYKYYITLSFLANSIKFFREARPKGLHKQSRCAICLANT